MNLAFRSIAFKEQARRARTLVAPGLIATALCACGAAQASESAESGARPVATAKQAAPLAPAPASATPRATTVAALKVVDDSALRAFLRDNDSVRVFAALKDIYWDDTLATSENGSLNDMDCQRVEHLANSLDAAAQAWPDSTMRDLLMSAADERFDAGKSCLSGDQATRDASLAAMSDTLGEFQVELHRVLAAGE